MAKIRITKQFRFETAHALYGYDGKCKNIHGHGYQLDVTLIGEPITDETNPKFGMVMDFGDVKKIVNASVVDVFDHGLILNQNSPHQGIAQNLEELGHKVILVDYQPSSENMIVDFAQRIQKDLPKHVSLFSLKLKETETAFAEWYASDNQ